MLNTSKVAEVLSKLGNPSALPTSVVQEALNNDQDPYLVAAEYLRDYYAVRNDTAGTRYWNGVILNHSKNRKRK